MEERGGTVMAQEFDSAWQNAVGAALTNSPYPFDALYHLPVAIYTTDREGRITYYNKASAELWGREPEIGKDLWCGSWKIVTPEGEPIPPDNYPVAIALKQGGPAGQTELVILREDGTRRLISPRPQPLFDTSGNLSGAMNTLIDITASREYEEALKESEARYRELASSLEKIIDQKTADLRARNEELTKSEERYHKMVEEVEDYAILLLDRNGIIQNWNAGAEKIKGYKDYEVIGRNFSIFYLPEDRLSGLPERLISKAINSGKAVHEGWRVRKDGTLFWGSVVITALHDAEQKTIGFSKVTRDLSEKKLSEDKIRQYASDLEFQNRELAQFAYAASHDLKEPLRKIQFYGNYVMDQSGGAMDEKSREYLNRVIVASRRMQKLIDDILAYSKTTSNLERIEPVDLNQTLDEIASGYRDEFATEKVSIEVDNLPVIQGIPFQLKQLFENLISNSVKYKHPARDSQIRISCHRVSGKDIPFPDAVSDIQYYDISVADNGIGFDAEHTEKIFNIFQRLHGKTEYSGSGIGLAICKRILQNHNGFITAHGVPNEGATFSLYIPTVAVTLNSTAEH